MSSVMVLQCLFISRGKRAFITDKRFNCKVSKFMFLQIIFTKCSIRALITGEGSTPECARSCAFKLYKM